MCKWCSNRLRHRVSLCRSISRTILCPRRSLNLRKPKSVTVIQVTRIRTPLTKATRSWPICRSVFPNPKESPKCSKRSNLKTTYNSSRDLLQQTPHPNRNCLSKATRYFSHLNRPNTCKLKTPLPTCPATCTQSKTYPTKDKTCTISS